MKKGQNRIENLIKTHLWNAAQKPSVSFDFLPLFPLLKSLALQTFVSAGVGWKTFIVLFIFFKLIFFFSEIQHNNFSANGAI